MSELGVPVLSIPDFDAVGPRQPLGSDLEEALEIAVQSALITFFRTDQPNRRKRLVHQTSRRLTDEGRIVYRGVRAVLEAHPDVNLVYLPNGRFPNQRMAHLAARDAGRDRLHFEKGETQNGMYLQPYPPQDRLASQDAVESTLNGLSRNEVEGIADAWLARRAPSTDSSNEFSALWDGELPAGLADLKSEETPIVGFFTSSQDEFIFLGPEWQRHEWKDQFEAFDLLLSRFEAAGFRSYLRVHPNLATKAQDCFVRERSGIEWLAARHPNLIVIGHDESVNTYSLLDVTSAVVIWDSTVGLEASARGIPVWTAATSRYGLVADIKEVLSRGQLDETGVEPWVVDPHKAKRFIAYIVRRDLQMDPDYLSWTPWDAAHPPLAARIASALVAGGAAHKSEAIKSIIDVYRHRSLRSNLRHLRSK
jgi:hypothetical protein